MKKQLLVFSSVMLLGASTVFGQVGSSQINYGGVTYPVQSIVKDNTTYVGVRQLGEATGLTVGYMADIHTVVVDHKNHNMQITLQDRQAYVNGVAVGEAPMILENGSTYLPFRWICEKLGFLVGYENGVIKVNTRENSVPIVPTNPNETVFPGYENFGAREYYMDYLMSLESMCNPTFDASRDGFDKKIIPAAQNRKKDIEATKTKLKGTEYEALAAKYEGLVDQIISLYENNGAGMEKIEDKMRECSNFYSIEAARLDISNETTLTIGERISTLESMYPEYIG